LYKFEPLAACEGCNLWFPDPAEVCRPGASPSIARLATWPVAGNSGHWR